MRELYRCLGACAVAALLLAAVASVRAADPPKPLNLDVPADARQCLHNWAKQPSGYDNLAIATHRDFARMILALHDQDRMNIEWMVPALAGTRQQLFDLQWNLADLGPLSPVVIDPPAAPPKIVDAKPYTLCTGTGCQVGTLVPSPVDPTCQRFLVAGVKKGVVKGAWFFPALNDQDFGPAVLIGGSNCSCPSCPAGGGCVNGSCGVQGCGSGGCSSCGSGGCSSGSCGRGGFQPFGGRFRR